MKRYTVSVYCSVFANVEVEAESEERAKELALQSKPTAFTTDNYTLEPTTVESVSEMADD